MIDIAQLPAAEMAAQLGHPTGEVGVAVGDYMNRVNLNLMKAAYRHLAPLPHDRILEIGLGNGKLISDLLDMAPGLSYAGMDTSETMISEAHKHNQALLEQGRLELHNASVERLPFPDATFDRALAVNAIYFWADQLSAPHVAVGTTPGFAVVDIAARRLVETVQPNPENENSDFHGIGVRVIHE
jgi:2-polyprenyl-3-methyl-5-hydroxy-6-metoxy-1,4-benzoquinol methylase